MKDPDTGKFQGTLTTIDETRAYWVISLSFHPIKVDIPPVVGGPGVLPPTLAVTRTGWAVLPVFDPLQLRGAGTSLLASTSFNGIKWSAAFGWDTDNSEWVSVLGGTVEVGKGYWVYIKETGVIVPQ